MISFLWIKSINAYGSYQVIVGMERLFMSIVACEQGENGEFDIFKSALLWRRIKL